MYHVLQHNTFLLHNRVSVAPLWSSFRCSFVGPDKLIIGVIPVMQYMYALRY